MKYISTYKLFENPNAILYKGKVEEWSVKDLTFSYYKTGGEYKFFSSDRIDGESLTHQDLLEWLWNDNISFDEDYAENFGRGKLSGRLFIDKKVITFWDFPKNQAELKEVAKDIYDDIGVDIYDDDYKIEIVINDDYLNVGGKGWGDWNPNENFVKYIPIQDYVSSKKRSDAELKQPHEVSPMKKNRKKEYHKNKPIEYRHALGKYRGESICTNFNNFRALD